MNLTRAVGVGHVSLIPRPLPPRTRKGPDILYLYHGCNILTNLAIRLLHRRCIYHIYTSLYSGVSRILYRGVLGSLRAKRARKILRPRTF